MSEIDDKTKAVLKKKGYKILPPIGHGTFGTVYKALFIKSGNFAAVKVIDLSSVDERYKDKFVIREMATMIEAKHKNVIQLYDIIISNKKLYIFMEFAAYGNLVSEIRKSGKPLTKEQANRWFRQSCEGVDYLHNTLGIAHRDLKLDNILLDEKMNAKIGDFGFAKKSYDSDNNEVIPSTTFCGTVTYQCPEITKKEAYDPFKADVWSMGVCLFGMLNDLFPFGDQNTFQDSYQMNKQMEENNFEKRYIKEFCKHVRRLIKKMLIYKQDDRYSIQDVLESKWVKEKGNCCD